MISKSAIDISLPLTTDLRLKLQCGQLVKLTGVIYTMRDQAHKRICKLLSKGSSLPFCLQNSVIYYAGPTPIMPNGKVGAIGPTTSIRMDPHTLPLIEAGVVGFIGKGNRNKEIVKALKKYTVATINDLKRVEKKIDKLLAKK